MNKQIKIGDYVSYVTDDIRKRTCVAVVRNIHTLKDGEIMYWLCSYGYDIDSNSLICYGPNGVLPQKSANLATDYQKSLTITIFDSNNIIGNINKELKMEKEINKEGKVLFAKTRNVKSPSRGDECASGIDMYIPEFDEQFMIDFRAKNVDISLIKPGNYDFYILPNKILIAPGARVCIPSGIKWLGKNGLSMNMHNKSGIGTKKGLVYLAEVVDKNYQGETHISIMNPSNNIVEICENEKIIQIMQEPVVLDEPMEVSLDSLYEGQESERGENWQGSTDGK